MEASRKSKAGAAVAEKNVKYLCYRGIVIGLVLFEYKSVIAERSTHVSSVSLRMVDWRVRVRVHLGAKTLTIHFWRGWRRIPLFFIVMIESIY